MRVLTLTAVAKGGGAESLALRIAHALDARGHASHVRVGATGRNTDDPLCSATPFDYGRGKLLHRLRYLPATVLTQLGIEQFVSKEKEKLLDGLPFQPDLIHCHNICTKLLRIEDLPWLCRTAPVVWTLHDMWPITGHCAHALDCRRWRDRCGRCPYLDVYVPLRFDFSRVNLWRRARVYRKIARESPGRFHLACPSRWLEGLVRESVARDLPIHCIPNGIDTALFRPLPLERRMQLRDRRGIPRGVFVALFVSHKGALNPFRDQATLVKALEKIRDSGEKNFFCVTAGSRDAGKERREEENVRELGYVDRPEEMAEVYALADAYIHATRADTHPLAIAEAMACGLPVVASRVGGVPELIEEGKTGILVRPGDPEEMAAAIIKLARDRDMRDKMGKAGEERARRFFSLERMVDDYLRLYERILSGRAA